jgi:CubicO group peptidase (beta-lactamase class C family)
VGAESGGGARSLLAEGRFDQFVYVVPDRELIIVRTGEEPRDMSWSSMFEAIVRRVDAVDRR